MKTAVYSILSPLSTKIKGGQIKEMSFSLSTFQPSMVYSAIHKRSVYMKKMMVCLLAVSLSSFALAQKIATVNLEEVIENHPQTEGNKRTLLETKQRYEKIRDDLRERLNTLYMEVEDLSAKSNDAALKESDRKKAQDEIKKMLPKVRQAEDDLRVKVAELQEALGRQELLFFQSAMDDIRKNLMEIVTAREIDLVIDKSAERLGAPTPIVLYANSKLDITENLIQLCKAAAEKAAK